METTNVDTDREPWNKGKLVGQKHRSSSRKYGRFASGFRSPAVVETLRYSIWLSLASFERATSHACGCVTSAMARSCRLAR